MSFLVLHSSQIYRRGGMANRWFALLSDRFTANVIAHAPERSGELRLGIWHEEHGAGTEMETIIHSDAPHTMYVIDGTTGPIMSAGRWDGGGGSPYEMREVDGKMMSVGKPGYWMKLRADGGGPSSFQSSVSGQSPNNFMLAGWAATGRQHTSVRGAVPILFH